MDISDVFDYQVIATSHINSTTNIKMLIEKYEFEIVNKINNPSGFEIGNYSRFVEGILNSEISKYACAALESYLFKYSSKLSGKSISWDLISTYYSAFFAAHACLKTVGILVSRISNKHVAILERESNKIFSDSLKPHASTYLIRYEQNSRRINFNHLDKGGYHEVFWKVFSKEFITIGLSSVKANQTVYQDELLFLNSILNNLNSSSEFSFLTKVRNEINYALPRAIWYPYTKEYKSEYYSHLFDTKSSRKKELSEFTNLESTDKYLKFVATCDALMHLMFDMVNFFFERGKTSHNNSRRHYYKLLKEFEKKNYTS